MVVTKVRMYEGEILLSTKEQFILRHPDEFFLVGSSLEISDLEKMAVEAGRTLTSLPRESEKKFLMDGDSDAYSFPLRPPLGWILVGRSDDCYVILNKEKVSRVHAKIYYGPDGKEINIFDNSSNGTYVNGKKISMRTPVRDGDIIGFSQSHLFNFYSNGAFYVAVRDIYRPKRLNRHRPCFKPDNGKRSPS